MRALKISPVSTRKIVQYPDVLVVQSNGHRLSPYEQNTQQSPALTRFNERGMRLASVTHSTLVCPVAVTWLLRSSVIWTLTLTLRFALPEGVL